jgi:hypothetical protein
MKEVTKEFKLCESGLALEIKGFDLEIICVSHLKSIGYSNLARILTPQEVEPNPWSPKTIVSSNIQSKKFK